MLRFFKERIKSILILMVVFIIAAGVNFTAFAEGGNGSGGGQSESLALALSYPANGQKDIKLETQIKLTFNKNMVNETVRDNNKNCFVLSISDGTLVPIKIIMADDQVEPDKKRDVIIEPEKGLKPGTSYILKISKNLKAKNGTTLGEDISLAFSTLKIEQPQNNPKDTGAYSVTKKNETAPPAKDVKKEATASKEINKKDEAVSSKDTAQNAEATVINDKPDTTSIKDINSKETNALKEAVQSNQSSRSYLIFYILGISVIAVGACILYALRSKKRK